MKKKVWVAGLLQAVGLSAYIVAIAEFIRNASNIFPPMNNFTGPLIFLALFTFSALMCGLITFFYPVKLFFIDKQQNEAIEVVLFTVLFLFIFLLLAFLFTVVI